MHVYQAQHVTITVGGQSIDAREVVVRPAKESLLERVAKCSRRWDCPAGIADELTAAGFSEDLAHAEALLHELCHAVVFGVAFDRRANDNVSKQFRLFSRRWTADRSECIALAVQKLVLDKLRWGLPFARIANWAIEDFDPESRPKAWGWINRARGCDVNQRRARRVLRFLETL